MLNKLVALVAKFTIGKSLLDLVNWLNSKASGARTEIVLAIEAILYVLKIAGVLDDAQKQSADNLALALLGALPVTLAEKVKKAREMGDRIIPGPSKP